MADQPAPRSGGGFFQAKWGPLPAWAWIAGGAVIAGVGFWWYKNHNASSAAATAATDTSGTQVDTGPSSAAIQSEIQQLQGEESTTSAEAEQAQDENARQQKEIRSQGTAVKSIRRNKETKPSARKKAPPKKPVRKTAPRKSNNTARRGR